MFESTRYYCPVGVQGYDPDIYITDQKLALACEAQGMSFVTLDVDCTLVCNGVEEEE